MLSIFLLSICGTRNKSYWKRNYRVRYFKILVQACRGKYHEANADDVPQSDQIKKYHLIKDTLFIFASAPGNRAWRPKTPNSPSYFIGILSKNLKKYGAEHCMDFIARTTAAEMSELEPVNSINAVFSALV